MIIKVIEDHHQPEDDFGDIDHMIGKYYYVINENEGEVEVIDPENGIGIWLEEGEYEIKKSVYDQLRGDE